MGLFIEALINLQKISFSLRGVYNSTSEEPQEKKTVHIYRCVHDQAERHLRRGSMVIYLQPAARSHLCLTLDKNSPSAVVWVGYTLCMREIIYTRRNVVNRRMDWVRVVIIVFGALCQLTFRSEYVIGRQVSEKKQHTHAPHERRRHLSWS